MSSSQHQTFWNLLDSYSIEIPIIQRDYAQGRGGQKESQIRKSFIKTLLDIVVDGNKTLNMDFIYGTIKDKTLTLLDGQQRLTTLFLLHWYIACRSNEISEAREKLKRFSYKTRVSSREFCEALVDDELINKDFSSMKEKKISSLIEDSAWFFSHWKKDPTIKSMLVMLDEIHMQFKDVKNLSLWGKLTSKNDPSVTFQFLNMDNFQLTDELYIKMNARGRPLTDFENLKAWLQGFVEKKGISVPNNIWNNMDKKWLDVFWKVRKEGVYEVDNIYLQFFKNVALFGFSKQCESQLSDEQKDFINQLRENDYFPVLLFEEYNVFDEGTLNRITIFLGWISDSINNDNHKEVQTIFKKSLSKPSYLDALNFYSLYLFITQKNNLTSLQSDHAEQNMLRWLRVTQNLIKNTAYDSSEDFVKAIHSLDLLSEGIDDLYDFVQNNYYGFFNKEQREEEKLKAKLILEDQTWNELLIKYERHSYFFGQIGFLLEYAKTDSGNYCKTSFEEYAEKASKLFGHELLNRDDFLLHRTLLSLGNYLIEAPQNNLGFCLPLTEGNMGAARLRNENWRKVFNDSNRTAILKKLLSGLSIGDEISGMEAIINETNTKDWRQVIIDYPGTIKYCERKLIRFLKKKDIRLLSKTRTSGLHAELYTYALNIDLQTEEHESFTLEDYSVSSGRDDKPAIEITWNDKTYYIYFKKHHFVSYIYEYIDNDEGNFIKYTGELPSSLTKKMRKFENKYLLE